MLPIPVTLPGSGGETREGGCTPLGCAAADSLRKELTSSVFFEAHY
jgi:hypothetical protein